MSEFRRQTRRQTKEQSRKQESETDEEKEQLDFSEDDNEELYEEEDDDMGNIVSDEEDNYDDEFEEEDEDYEDDDDEEEERRERKKSVKKPKKETEKSSRKTKSNKTKKQAKQKVKNAISYDDMKKLYLKRSQLVEHSDKIYFTMFVNEKYIKDEHGRIGVIKKLKLSHKPVRIDDKLVAWKLVVQFEYGSNYSTVEFSNISDDDITKEEYQDHIDRMAEETQISKEAKQLIKNMKGYKKYTPTENDEKEHEKYLEIVHDGSMSEDNDDIDTTRSKKSKEKNSYEEEDEDYENEEKMEEIQEVEEKEIPADFVFTEDIFKKMEECHKMCDMIEKDLHPVQMTREEMKNICCDFFGEIEKKMDEEQLAFEQVVVVPKQGDDYDKKEQVALADYL